MPPVPLEHVEFPSLATESTPFLVFDRRRIERNVARLRSRITARGATLRPHLKTVKSVEAARLAMDGASGPVTVSTLKEAEEFAAAGISDMIYAVGIAPQKLDRVAALRKRKIDIAVILDSLQQAEAVAAKSRERAVSIPALIEIDCDGHRSGLLPDDPEVATIAHCLQRGGAEMRGILTHAGHSYFCSTQDALRAAAENERRAATACAERLRAAGLSCPVVSIGSTPTAHFAETLEGVTEVRAGVFMLFDLVMAGIGVCGLRDIAASVVATVIGSRPDKGWLFIDAGWMALSRDRGTARQSRDQGYGVVCTLDGQPFPDIVVADVSQEHGIISIRPSSNAVLPSLSVGDRVRILPNHACATAAQHASYAVINDDSGRIVERWPRIQGW